MPAPDLPVYLLLAAVLTVALVVCSVLGTRLARASERLQALEREASELRSDLTRLRFVEDDHQFLGRFLKDFSHLAREFHSKIQPRRIPQVLLSMLVQSFEIDKALVAVRKKGMVTTTSTPPRLVVAAVAPEDLGIESGLVIEAGEGEVGYAVEAQRVMDRQDFQYATRLERRRIRRGRLEGLAPDLVAPMIIGEEVHGALAVAGLRKHRPHEKEIIRLIAMMGAFALHNVGAFSEMKLAASVDPLTGVLNKRALNFKLGELLYRAREDHTDLSIFLLDLDHFKNYNDLNGHQAGDELLRSMSRLILESVRDEDLLGRFGGEEFLLILPHTGPAQALVVAEKIRSRIASHAFPFADRQPLGTVSISGGVACFPQDGLDSSTLLRAADEALYRAKQKGRNRIELATSGAATR